MTPSVCPPIVRTTRRGTRAARCLLAFVAVVLTALVAGSIGAVSGSVDDAAVYDA
jgi:hypothetical protein